MKDSRDYNTERNTTPRRRPANSQRNIRRPDRTAVRNERDERRERSKVRNTRSEERLKREYSARRNAGTNSKNAASGRQKAKSRENDRKRQMRNLKAALIGAASVLVVLIVIYCIIAAGYSKKFLPHTYVNGFNVGRYSVSETEEVLKKSVEKYKLEIAFRGGRSEVISGNEMGLTYVSSNEVSNLVANQKRFSWIASIFGKKHYYYVSTSFQYDSAKLRSCLESLPEFDAANITQPVNSTIVLDADLTFRTSTPFEGNQPNEDVIFNAVDEAVNGSVSRISVEDLENAYARPSVTSEDSDLLSRVEYLNDYLETDVTIVYRDGSKDVINRERLASWAKKDDSGLYALDDNTVYNQIYSLVNAAAKRDNEIHDYMDFNSTNNGVVRLWCSDPWGYKINVDSQTDKIFQAVYAHEKTEYEIQNSVKPTMEDKVGQTYIEVDITNQHLYYYVDGSLYLQSYFVSGQEDESEFRTPSGAYAIFDLQENVTLGSLQAADETQRYESHVDYWMPFYESYGLHDASWRDEFGGEIYKYAGSHGCVNLPVDFAKQLYSSLAVWTPVFVLRASDAASTSEHSLDAVTE